jgi:hypothetical protein
MLQTVTLPTGSQEKEFLSRALNCCFLADRVDIKESLFRLIRHFIVDEEEFSRLKLEAPGRVVLAEFQHQFKKEFRFDGITVPAEKAGYTLKSLMDDEWRRCGNTITFLESHYEVLSKWPLSLSGLREFMKMAQTQPPGSI